MFVRTRRLTLRPGWPEDAPALARAIADQGIVMMLSRAPWPYGLADAQAFLASAAPVDEPRFLIFEHCGDRPELVGGIGVHRDDAGTRELGYWLSTGARGRGLMTEAGRAVLTSLHASLGIRHLVAGHFIDNPASARLLARLGFTPTGDVRPRPCLARGHDVGCVLHEWHATSRERAIAA